jgi:hypothetical protein
MKPAGRKLLRTLLVFGAVLLLSAPVQGAKKHTFIHPPDGKSGRVARSDTGLKREAPDVPWAGGDTH